MKNIVLLIAILLTLCSCGELKEEIWVYPNNDVRLEVSINMGKEQGVEMLSPALGLLDACLGSNAEISSSIAERAERDGFMFDTVISLKNQPALRYDSLLLMLNRKDQQNQFTKQEKEKLAKAINHLAQVSQIAFNADSQKNTFMMAFKMGRIGWNDLLFIGQGLQKMNKIYNVASTDPDHFLFTVEDNRFVRGNYLINASALNLRLQSGYSGLIKLLGNNDYKYISIVHLPGAVQKTTHPLSVISNDGKTVTTTLNLDALNARTTIGNTILFK